MSAGTSYNLEKMLKLRGLKERVPFTKLFTDEKWHLGGSVMKGKFVIAWSPGSGKTWATLHILDRYFSYPQNVNKKALIITSDERILRSQFAETATIGDERFPWTFRWVEVRTRKELLDAINDKSIQVIFALPQTLNNNISKLPKFNILVHDEAHEWHHAPTIKKILKQCKPDIVLNLTGTPENFVLHNQLHPNDPYLMDFVTLLDLRHYGDACNIKTHMVMSGYNWKLNWYSSWNSRDTLKSSYIRGKKGAKLTFDNVIDEMYNRVIGPTKFAPSLTNITGNKLTKIVSKYAPTILTKMHRGMWVMGSVKEADVVYERMNSYPELRDRVLLSHSEHDNGENLNKFKYDTTGQYLALIVVDRGRKGYDVPEMNYIVDMSLSKNLSRNYQLVTRLARVPRTGTNTIKHFFKVAPADYIEYFASNMRFSLSLSHKDNISQYTGKNGNTLRIPIRVKKAPKGTPTRKTITRNGKQYVLDVEDIMFPNDIDFWNYEYLSHDKNKVIQGFANVTIDEIGVALHILDKRPNGWYTKERVVEIAASCSTLTEFIEKDKAAYSKANKLGWIAEVCEHMKKKPQQYWNNIDNVIQYAKQYNNEKEWKDADYDVWRRVYRSKRLPLVRKKLAWNLNPLKGRIAPNATTQNTIEQIKNEYYKYITKYGKTRGVVVYLADKFNLHRLTMGKIIKDNIK